MVGFNVKELIELMFVFPRELLRSEAALAKLYCRMALLNIFAPKSPHMFTRLFHIPAIRDITLEHLQLLSNQLLAPPLPGKHVVFSQLFFGEVFFWEQKKKEFCIFLLAG